MLAEDKLLEDKFSVLGIFLDKFSVMEIFLHNLNAVQTFINKLSDVEICLYIFSGYFVGKFSDVELFLDNLKFEIGTIYFKLVQITRLRQTLKRAIWSRKTFISLFI